MTIKSPRETSTVPINRSMPQSSVIPVLAYADVREAVDWLCRAFGFVERLRIGTHRAQLCFGDGAIVVVGEASPANAGSPSNGLGHSIMVRVADVDDHHEHAARVGARIISRPTDFPYGERQYTAEDLAGHCWTFSQSIANVDPSSWDGTLLEHG